MRRWLLSLGLLLGLGLAQGLVLEDDLVQALELSPGQEALLDLALRNEGDRVLRVRVELADYEEGRGFLPPGSLARSLAANVVLAASEVSVPAQGRASLRLTLRAPADLKGTRYAYLLLTPEEAEGGQGGPRTRHRSATASIISSRSRKYRLATASFTKGHTRSTGCSSGL